MMDPVSLTDLQTAVHAEFIGGDRDRSVVTRVTTDSRDVRPGDLFWALHGQRHDGHDFVPEALARGARAAVVERRRAESIAGPRLVVRDTQAALGDFARWNRRRSEALVVGVTGSVGKTTTRELIHMVLSTRYTGLQSRKNFNNEIGLPLCVLDLEERHEFAVFELGAARRGDIRALCDVAAPEVGVVTRIGPAHVETFGSLEAIYEGKGELLEALPAGGFAVVGGDDDRMREMARRAACPVRFFGERSDADVRAVEVEFRPGRLQFAVDRQRFELPAPARHHLSSALAALAVAREIGMSVQDVAEGFRNFQPPPGRCRIESVGSWTVIDETYNASPLSMQAACACLAEWPAAGRRLLIAGDMLELGERSPSWHAELGSAAASANVDWLLTVGRYAHDVARGARQAGFPAHQIAAFSELEPLLSILDCWLGPGDVVLVKGSRGMKMERVVEWLKTASGREKPNHPPVSRKAA